jgi:hypothetical protein
LKSITGGFIVTGDRLREAIRYVDLISEYYTEKED